MKLGTKLVGIIALGILLLVAIGLLIAQWQKGRTAAAESRLERAQSGAVVESAKDAIATQGAAAEREKAIEKTGDDHEAAIRAAPGADAPLDRGLNRAARSRMCDYAANRNKPECRVQPTRP